MTNEIANMLKSANPHDDNMGVSATQFSAGKPGVKAFRPVTENEFSVTNSINNFLKRVKSSNHPYNRVCRWLIDDLGWTISPEKNNKVLEPNEVIDYVFSSIAKGVVIAETELNASRAPGCNVGKRFALYPDDETKSYIDVCWYEDEISKYTSQYVNQKVVFHISGNGCQALRAHNAFNNIWKIVNDITTKAGEKGNINKLDITCDIFNMSIKPKYVIKKSIENKFTGKFRTVSSHGSVEAHPSAVLGTYGSDWFFRFYDKYQENVDKEVDEPELFNAVSVNKKWVRLEMHYGKERAEQASDWCVSHADEFGGLLNAAKSIFIKAINDGFRLLQEPKDDNPRRIATDRKWEGMIKLISKDVKPSDFTYQRQTRTAYDKMKSFLNGDAHSGINGLSDIYDIVPVDEYMEFNKLFLLKLDMMKKIKDKTINDVDTHEFNLAYAEWLHKHADEFTNVNDD